MYARLGYDPAKDFAPVVRLLASSFMMAVNSAVPATSLKELIAVAKARPGRLDLCSAGTGTTPHLCGELFKIMANVDIVHVPYKAGGAAMTALASGEAQVGCQPGWDDCSAHESGQGSFTCSRVNPATVCVVRSAHG